MCRKLFYNTLINGFGGVCDFWYYSEKKGEFTTFFVPKLTGLVCRSCFINTFINGFGGVRVLRKKGEFTFFVPKLTVSFGEVSICSVGGADTKRPVWNTVYDKKNTVRKGSQITTKLKWEERFMAK